MCQDFQGMSRAFSSFLGFSRRCELIMQQLILLLHSLQARLSCLHLGLAICTLPSKSSLCLILRVK